MNRKQSKKINQKVIDIFIEWLTSVVPEEEAKKIVRKNYKQYIPPNAYYYKGYTIKNSLFSPRWIKRKLKRLKKQRPAVPISSYSMSDLK